MNVKVVPFEQLTGCQLQAWSRFQQADPALESPYFRPEFAQCVASVRDDVQVAVLERDGRVAGLFPFQRRGRHLAVPVGGRLSDYQGVIAQTGFTWNAADLLRGSDLLAWDFDHLIVSQEPFRAYHRLRDLSPQLDVSRGFDEYCGGLRRGAADELRQTLRKQRKLHREVGSTHFEFASTDGDLLAALIGWKSAQYRRTQVADVFASSWTVNLLRRILTFRDEPFAGVLSVLFAGRRPVAIHMGMRSRGVLHWWFPAYDPQLARYSPGRILLAELVRAATDQGVEKIDLGRGLAPYKSRSMSAAVSVAEGSVDLRPLAGRLRNGWRRTKDWVRASPFHGPARVPGRMLRNIREWFTSREGNRCCPPPPITAPRS